MTRDQEMASGVMVRLLRAQVHGLEQDVLNLSAGRVLSPSAMHRQLVDLSAAVALVADLLARFVEQHEAAT